VNAPEQLRISGRREREDTSSPDRGDAVSASGWAARGGTYGNTSAIAPVLQPVLTYLVRNRLLIHLQYPEATRGCAGAAVWHGQVPRPKERRPSGFGRPSPTSTRTRIPGRPATAISGFCPARCFDFSQMAEADARPLLSSINPRDRPTTWSRNSPAVPRSKPPRPGGVRRFYVAGVSRWGTHQCLCELDSRNQLFVLHELARALPSAGADSRSEPHASPGGVRGRIGSVRGGAGHGDRPSQCP